MYKKYSREPTIKDIKSDSKIPEVEMNQIEMTQILWRNGGVGTWIKPTGDFVSDACSKMYSGLYWARKDGSATAWYQGRSFYIYEKQEQQR
jgi:hypothetical protein